MVAAPAARMRAGHLQPPKSMEVEELAPFEGCSKQQQQQTGLPEKISTISYALDTYSHPLVVESKTAFHALLIVPLVIWWLAVVAGIWVYEGLPKGQRIYHSMLWFDSKILRPAGPLVPFVIVILRALVHGADYVYRHGRSSSAAVARAAAAKAARGAAGKQPLVKLGSLIGWCLAIYVAMAVARVGIYLTHWFLLTNRYVGTHQTANLSVALQQGCNDACGTATSLCGTGVVTISRYPWQGIGWCQLTCTCGSCYTPAAGIRTHISVTWSRI